MDQNPSDPAGSLPFVGSYFAESSLLRLDFSRLLKGWPMRTAAILILFVLQGLWLTIRFDSASLAAPSGSLAGLLEFAPRLPRIGVTFLFLIPLLMWNRIPQHAREFSRSAQQSRKWWLWCLAQWATFAVLTASSGVLFSDQATDSWRSDFLAIVWISSVVLTSLCCLFAIAPPGYWLQFVCSEAVILFAGLALSLTVTVGAGLFQQLWAPLATLTFSFVCWWLGLVYQADLVVSDPQKSLLGTRSFYVHIAPECSGYEGMGLMAAFILVFLFLFRRHLRFPHAWLLLPIGMVTIWCCNSLRIAGLIVVGTEYSSSVALGGFHSQAGWILFNLVSLGLMAAAMRSPFFAHRSGCPVREPVTAAPYLVPFLGMTGLSMLIAAAVEDASTLYPVTVAVSFALLWINRKVLAGLNWTPSPRAVACGVCVFVIWSALAWVQFRITGTGVASLPSTATVGGLCWTILRVAGAVITVPVIEELAFRGFLLRRLSHCEFQNLSYRSVSFAAVVASSVIFGLMHQLWIGGIIAGLAYAWMTRERGQLTDAILAHAVTNGLLATTVLWTGATWLW